jgi:hypothetical protein
VQQLLGWHRELPEQEERARLLREVRDIVDTAVVYTACTTLVQKLAATGAVFCCSTKCSLPSHPGVLQLSDRLLHQHEAAEIEVRWLSA